MNWVDEEYAAMIAELQRLYRLLEEGQVEVIESIAAIEEALYGLIDEES